MTSPNNRVEAADTEAAQWHARLGARSVATQTIKDFFDWRQVPENADAYRRVEIAWSETRKLACEPKMRAALDEVLARGVGQRKKPRSPRVMMGIAAATASAILIFAGWSWVQSRTVFATSVGEQRVVQLADGSSVRLDTDSRIRVRFDGERRGVELEAGQALFEVAHDAGRPFVVRAGQAKVTAIGTVFDVRRRPTGTNVTLVSGAVEIAGGGDVWRIRPGEQAKVTATGAVATAVDVAAVTGWTEGRIIFRDTPLSEAVAEVNRYLTDEVELNAPALANEPVNGVFKTGDRDAFVSVTSEVFGLRASPGSDGAIRLSEGGK